MPLFGPGGPVIVAVTERAQRARDALAARGAEVLVVPEKPGMSASPLFLRFWGAAA